MKREGLILSIGVLLCFSLKAQQPSFFSFTPTNTSATIYGQATIDGVAASANDWIAAFDASGNCCGASQLIVNSGSAYINLVIYGDDATTATFDEGMSGNENFTLKIYQASSSTYIDYPSSTNITYLSGWANTNGAPLGGYDNPATIYDFQNSTSVTLNLNLLICENVNPYTLTGGQPAGGLYSGSGVSNGIFDPITAGVGSHIITYTVNGASDSVSVVVFSLADATLLSTGPYCDNDASVVLSSATLGGTYSGSGVIANNFNPSVVGSGSYWIYYFLIDGNGCVQNEQTLVEVNASPTPALISQNNNVLESNIIANSYQWYDASMNIIIGAIFANYEPTINGNYYVEVSNGDCSSMSTAFAFLGTTGINDITSKINILVSDVILVSDENTIDYISITNILGAQVYSKQLNQHHIKIDNNFPNGLYIISILQADVVETIKIKL
jgi:hypothetical protein